MAMDVKSEYVNESLSLALVEMKPSMCRESIEERIGAVSYHADKGKQLALPSPFFFNCVM